MTVGIEAGFVSYLKVDDKARDLPARKQIIIMVVSHRLGLCAALT